DRGDRPGLGQRFIEVAAQALRPGGRLFLVANRHLPYEATLARAFTGVQVLAQGGGFKVVEALKGGPLQERTPRERAPKEWGSKQRAAREWGSKERAR